MPVVHLWTRGVVSLATGVGVVAGMVAVAPQVALAADPLQVTTTADSGVGSLRQALADSTTGDTITFAPSVTGTIAIASPLAVINAVTTAGPGPGVLTIDGGNKVQDLVIGSGTGTVTVSGLTLTRGNGSTGGAINDYFGHPLALKNVAITNSSASTSGGGAYVSQTSLSVTDSTVSGNTAPQGGGLFVELPAGENLVVQGSTFSDNTATSGQGAGIYAAGSPTVRVGSARSAAGHRPRASVPPPPPPPPPAPATSVGAVAITTSTITGNHAGTGNAAIYLHQLDAVSRLSADTIAKNSSTGLALDSPAGDKPTLAATILAKNAVDCGGAALTDRGYDIDSDGSCLFAATGSKSHSSKIGPALSALAKNGGPTATMSISASHDPAHGVVPATFAVPGGVGTLCGAADQRGVLPATSPCDVGAFQRERAPKITARVHSKTPKTRYGWYGSPVRLSFICRSASPFISVKCTSASHLEHDGRNLGAKGKVVAQDGRSAAVAVHGLKLDLTPPTIDGAKDGASYGQDPKITCDDALSGIAQCKVHRHRHHSAVTFAVTAVDKAGNKTVRKGSYTLL